MTETTSIDPPRSGRDIRRYRLEQVKTVEQLAREIGIAPQTLDKVEKGESNLWLKSLEKVAAYFNNLPEFEDVQITVLTLWPELMEDEAA